MNEQNGASLESLSENIATAMKRLAVIENRLPKWADSIIGRTKQQFFAELDAMQQRIKEYQLKQMGEFVSFSTRLVGEMANEIKKEARRNGHDFLVAMRKEKDSTENEEKCPSRPKN